jgi:chemotaxis protein MotB
MARKKNHEQLILVQRRVSSDEDEEHNGAWKLAYADFVTAMMTFFLIMWLMNTISAEQRKGIADYFNPIAVSQSYSGADGILSGRAADTQGTLTTPNAPGEHSLPVASPPVVASVGDSDREAAGRKDPMPNPPGSPQKSESQAEAKDQPPMPRDARAELEAMLDRESQNAKEQMALDQTERSLRESLADSPELANLADSVVIQKVAEGLRVQLTDQAKVAMFAVGSAKLNDSGRKLLRLVAGATAKAPNPLTIAGHTDALGYAADAKYGNWELSSDRANAARRELLAAGIQPGRIIRVEGRADLDHLMIENPLDPRNRRISITLMRAAPPPPGAAPAQPAAAPSTATHAANTARP